MFLEKNNGCWMLSDSPPLNNQQLSLWEKLLNKFKKVAILTMLWKTKSSKKLREKSRKMAQKKHYQRYGFWGQINNSLFQQKRLMALRFYLKIIGTSLKKTKIFSYWFIIIVIKKSILPISALNLFSQKISSSHNNFYINNYY